MLNNLYFYKGNVTAVYDGDTVTVTIDLGMKIKREGIKIRLYGIDAPELRGNTLIEARESRDFLRSKVLGKEVLIQTIKDKRGKYGRYLGKIWIYEEDSWVDINENMITEGYALGKTY